MERREFLRRVGVALAGLSLTSQTSNSDTRPNFLVVMTDDQPHYTIPYMDAVSSTIKNQGVTFSPHAYVSTPICSPARATLLTGKWSHNTNHTLGGYKELRDSGLQNDTVATRLKNAGYATFFGGKYINGYDGWAVPPGWDSWFAMVEPVNATGSFRYRAGDRIKKYDRAVYNETDVLRGGVERFVRNRAGSSQPWFAYVCQHAPHGPYTPASRHADGFAKTPLRRVPSVAEKDLSDKPVWVQNRAPYTDRERKINTIGYRGKLRELQEVDDLVGRLMNALVHTNQLANTWVFFLTDNGYLLGEHGLAGKSIPYEESSRTPFLVRGPGLPGGVQSDALVSHVDLPPTLLDFAGASWSDLDGDSLLPVLTNGGARPDGWRNELLVEDLVRGWNMLRTMQYAYVEWNSGEKELYDMNSDPYQLRSLHADPGKADLIAQLSSRLSEMKRCSGPSCRSSEVAL